MEIKSENDIIKEVNKYFIIQWKLQTERQTHLVGAGKYHTIVGEETKNKHFKKVLELQQDIYTFKIRNHLRIKFFVK